MKKILLLLLVISMASCSSNYITVESLEDGKISHIKDFKKVSKLNDTLVIRYTMRSLSIYGRYIGVVPKNTTIGTTTIWYSKVKRIK